MKLLLILILCCVPTLVAAKVKEVPLPRPSPIRLAMASYAQAATNPDPFKVQPQPTTQPQPAPQPTPVVVTTQPTSTQGEILQWVWAAIGALFTGILGKVAIKPPALPSSKAPTLDPSNPDVKDMIDRALLKAIETGIPGRLIQTGLGTIPGVGGIAGGLEPLVRSVVVDILKHRVAGGEVDVTGMDVPQAQPQPQGLGLPQDIFARLGQIVEQKVAERLGGKP